MTKTRERERSQVPQPAEPPAPGVLPSSLTFHLTRDERAAVLRVLRSFRRGRTAALLEALGVTPSTPAEPDTAPGAAPGRDAGR